MESKINLNYSYTDFDVDPNAALTFWNDSQDGFVYPLENMIFSSKKDLMLFCDYIKEEFLNVEVYDYSIDKQTQIKLKNNVFRIYLCNDGSNYVGNAVANSEKVLHKIWRLWIDKFDPKNTSLFTLNVYSLCDGSLDCRSSSITSDVICNAEKDFYPYIDTNKMFEQFFKGKENILLLIGKSGIGKSKFSVLGIKYLMEHPELFDTEYCNIAHITNVNLLAMDDVWNEIKSRKTKLVIVDDLDYMLSSRELEISSTEDIKRNDFLKRFLTFTDGIEKNDTKFIITTNQNCVGIDNAILRKGRLFDIIELRSLKKSEAQQIWKDHNLDNFDKYNMKFPIVAADLAYYMQCESEGDNRIDKSYLKEQKISQLSSILEQSKFGLKR